MCGHFIPIWLMPKLSAPSARERKSFFMSRLSSPSARAPFLDPAIPLKPSRGIFEREINYDINRRVSSKRSTSTNPKSVSFRLGITGKDIKAIVIKGS